MPNEMCLGLRRANWYVIRYEMLMKKRVLIGNAKQGVLHPVVPTLFSMGDEHVDHAS